MQSGISVSRELKSVFNTLVTSPNQRGVLCTIKDESLTPLKILEPASKSFSDDLVTLLAPNLESNVALYIILRRYDLATNAPFTAITYVPDVAPVRSKMLFASTRLTLVRELGNEHFRETLFVTTKEELTSAGFKKYDEHVLLEAPLTEEEKSLGEVKRKEAEESRGMMEQKKGHVMSSLSMPASDDVMNGLVEIEKSSTTDDVNFVQLKINIETETLELDTKAAIPITTLATNICSTAPRYTFYRYFHSHNGVTCSPTFFIYTCPSDSKIKERMLYAATSRSVQNLAHDIGLVIDKKIEESHPSEITEESVRADLYPKVEVTKRFERPRRPGANKSGF